ncbi:glutathione S-transferase family protein [Telmatospirillum sp. J64-1]|uniref:FtsZ-binding protein FzlA n=1 Tax=Telmatospirillum sp. J64-1 TaxID=2502183 RepID=UPI00115CA6D0|nr:glutathione S-transferase family protein [Telmatospirillum sp. J64-1]
MRSLYHLPLCPFSRRVRIALAEKRLDFELVEERPWERKPEFLALNPAGEVPVLVHDDGTVLSGATPICEYLDETVLDPPLLGHCPDSRAEVRRLVDWFDVKFNREVTLCLVGEKVMKRMLGNGGPDSRAVRAGFANIRIHLDYLGWLIDHRRWLAGDHFSLADIAAAAHLSCVDYVGDVPWEDYPSAKDWYARVKSRPSFRPLLADRLVGSPPPAHYADLDF